jgi:hypothetical protein
MVKFEQKMKHLHNCSQLTSVLSVSSVVKSFGFKLVAYRHNECLGLELFIVKNKPPFAAAHFAPSFRRTAKEDPIVFCREPLDLLSIASAQGGFQARAGFELEFQIEDVFDHAVVARSFIDLEGALPLLQPPHKFGQAQNAGEFGFCERTNDLRIRAAEGFWNFEFHKSCCSGLDV